MAWPAFPRGGRYTAVLGQMRLMQLDALTEKSCLLLGFVYFRARVIAGGE
jgi:hypothetical protein